MKEQNILRRFSKWIFVACGIWLSGLGGYMLARPLLLPEDLRYPGSSEIQLEMLLPHLASWLLLAPAVAWLLGLASYGAGWRAEHAIVAVRRPMRRRRRE